MLTIYKASADPGTRLDRAASLSLLSKICSNASKDSDESAIWTPANQIC